MIELDLTKKLKQLEKRLILIYVGSLIVLSALAVFSNQILKEQVAAQATSFVRRMVKIGDLRETILTLSQAKLDYFNAVVYYDGQGTRVFSLPVDLDPKLMDQNRIRNALKYGYINTKIYFGSDSASPLGTLTFAYGRYEYVKYTTILWVLLVMTTFPLIFSVRRSITRRYENDLKIRGELARASLARAVRHDIRSPLISLQGFLSTTKSLNEMERRVLDRIVTRIFGILADLEDTPSDNGVDSATAPVEDVVREVVREKQLQLKKIIRIILRFEPSSFLAYTTLSRVQLSRIISNILGNSIDAINGKGKIEISLRVALGFVMLKITDDGKGIPADVLPKIFEKNFSYEKSTGSGIGLSTAKEAIEACGGRISATSAVGTGTSIEIELPVGNQPAWWMDKIETADIAKIVVVDDQETSHDAWRMKLCGSVECEHLASGDELEKWLANNNAARTLFLVDFDLGSKGENGIELMRKHRLTDRAILVTGNFDDTKIQNECAGLGIKLLPKPLIDGIAVI